MIQKKKDTLIDVIAKMIDSEGAFSANYTTTGLGSKPIPPSSRQKYFQAKYRHTAVKIVRLLLDRSHEDLIKELVSFEKNAWKELGVDMTIPEIKDMVDKLIENKCGSASFL